MTSACHPETAPEIEIIESLARVDASAWDACAGTDNPFIRHGFLSILEESGSCRAETGWAPRHLLLRAPGGQLVGAVPAYLKSHSYGEYVFDHGWAQAYEQAGGRYYPKLQVSVPFTPATGPRLLLHPGCDREQVAETLISALEAVADRLGVSSVHVTFPRTEDHERLVSAGWLARLGYQFHWDNPGYQSFDDFLADLSSRKRKAIRKERAEVARQDLELVSLTGADLRPEHFDAFYRFYCDTTDRKWGYAYLTRDFFELLCERYGDHVLLVLARHDGNWVAGALNLIGENTLYGRNWGCLADFRFLHFEACYYRAIDFAIERGLKRVEAGAQGQHKIQRGYLPNPTFSAHYVRHAGFRDAVARFLERERAAAEHDIALLAEQSPFRRGAQD